MRVHKAKEKSGNLYVLHNALAAVAAPAAPAASSHYSPLLHRS